MCLCQEENWKCFVLLEHLSSYNFVHRATNIKLREKGRNVVGQQLPTMNAITCSRECKRTQHVTSNDVGGCLHGASDACTGSPVTLQLTFYHVQKVHHSMLIIGAKQNWWLLHEWWFENTLSSAWIQLDLFHIFSQHANAPKTLSNNMAYGWFRIEQNQMPPRSDKST